jgi:hypothetical protein
MLAGQCLPGFAQDGYGPVAGGRQRPGAVHHLLELRVEVQALVDAGTKRLSQNAVRQAHRERGQPCNPLILSLSKGAA